METKYYKNKVGNYWRIKGEEVMFFFSYKGEWIRSMYKDECSLLKKGLEEVSPQNLPKQIKKSEGMTDSPRYFVEGGVSYWRVIGGKLYYYNKNLRNWKKSAYSSIDGLLNDGIKEIEFYKLPDHIKEIETQDQKIEENKSEANIVSQTLFNLACKRKNIEYPEDCQKIQSIAKKEIGIDMSLEQAEDIWKHWSSNVCAGWLFVSSKEVPLAIKSFILDRLGLSDE